MTKGDLLFCYTCKAISHDVNILKMQDGRFNPNWNYRCGFCYGFKTINASQFLGEGQTETFILLKAGNNPETLKAYGRELKATGVIRGFRVKAAGRSKYKLFERIRTKKVLLFKAMQLRD